MISFFVPQDLMLYSHEMSVPSDFSVRGFSGGQSEDASALTVSIDGVSTPELWTPAEITTALWLDAADSATITVIDSKVSQRADKSGNNRHATQPTASMRPVAGTNKDDFDGVDDKLVISHVDALSAPAYIAIVSKANVTGQYKGLLDKWATDGWAIDYGTTATQGRPRLSVNSTASIVAPTSVHNNLCIIEAQISGSSSFVGTPAGVTTGTLPTPNSTALALFIGGDGVSTLPTDLDFHEMVVLGTAPDATTRAKIQGHLAHKWDAMLGVTTLVSALPSDHPYKSAAPTL